MRLNGEYDEFRSFPMPIIRGLDIDWSKRTNQIPLQVRADMAEFTRIGPERLGALFEHWVNLARNDYADASTFGSLLTDGETRVLLSFIIGASAAGS